MPCVRRLVARGSAAAVLFLAAACAGDDSTGLTDGSLKPATAPAAVAITPRADTLGIGQSRALTARVTDATGAVMPNAVAWKSADPAIASVTSDGRVTVLAPGLARIVAAVVSAPSVADTARIFARAQDIIVEPNAISMAVGERMQLVASRPSGAAFPSGSTTTWSSSNQSIARVGPDGTVSAIGEGEATLIAEVDGKQGSALVSIRTKDIASLRVSPATSSIYPGGAQQMLVVAYDDAGREMNLDAASTRWSVSDARVATVDDAGKATGVAKGSAVVIAKIGGRQATASLNVLAAPAATVSVSLAMATLEVGQTTQAAASVVDVSGSPIASPTVAWQSSNPAIATVNSSGLVTAVARGSVTINAVTDGKTGGAPLSVAAKAVTSVAVSPAVAAALQGQSVQLTATAKDPQGTALPGKTFTWQSANPAIATVSAAGLVTSVGPGTTTITATTDGVSGTSTFSTTQQAVASVSVTPTTSAILPGQELQLSASATDATGTTVLNRVPVWASSNPTVATVSSSGKVTAVSKGSTNISATIDGKSAAAAIAVNEPAPAPVASITVTLNSSSLAVGQSTQAVAVLRDASGNVLTGRAVSWSSEAPTLATVSSSGLVAAVAAGTATITATAEGKTGNATVTIQAPVAAPVATIALSATSTSMFVGQSQAITVTLRDAAGNLLTGRSISWSSSNLAAVTVAPNGTVTAVGSGSATVTATSEGKSSSISFTVAAVTPVAPVSSVALTAPATTLSVGQSVTVTVTLKDGHGVVLTGRAVTWSSSAPNVASVSSAGVVTALTAGSAVISASSEGVVGSLPFVVSGPGGSTTVSVTLSTSALTVGQTTQAAAVARDGSGTTLGGTASWSTSNSAIATVSSSGLVTAVGAGTADIRATISGVLGAASLAVTTSGGSTVSPTPAELPRSVPSFTVPAASRVYTVTTDLQRAIDTARAGDEIQLSGTFTGNFKLPTRACGSWVTIRSVANPPAAGVRVTPSAAAGFAKIVTPNNAAAIITTNPTCGWRFLGVEITGTLAVTSVQYGLVWLGDGGWIAGGDTQDTMAEAPQQILFDRVYIHGTPTLNVVRCVAMNSGATIIRDSWLSECHAKGFDSQAIAGWNGPGPYLIENNHLAGAGENVMFGGADPGIPNLVPSDITIRRNHFFKPLNWRSEGWSVKNLFELKSAQRVLAEGNVFENSWPSAQEGMAIVIKSNANGCQCAFEGTRDFTFRYNIVRNAAVGLNLQASDDSYGWTGFTHVQRVAVSQNLFTNIGQEGRASLMMLTHDLNDIVISNNTMVHASGASGLALTMAYSGGAAHRMVWSDNVVTATTGYALFYDGGKAHTEALNTMMLDKSWRFDRNVVGGVMSDYTTLNPGTSWYPTSVSGIGLASDFSLASSSPYKGKGVGGADPGANIAEVTRQTAGVIVP